MSGSVPTNKILHGACEDVLRTLPDSCVDAVVTDPPYGLGTKEPTAQDIELYLQGKPLDTGGDFMGKAWKIPSVPTWKECYRVLKPGGYVLSFAGCYDEHTEVLTRKGWVRFPDVTGDEEFASLDPETHKIEWQRAKEVVRQPNPGGMVRYKTNKVDLLVTPNHKMFVATLGSSEPKFRLIRADEHGLAIKMTKTSRGRMDAQDPGCFRLPAVMQTTSHGHEVELPEKVIPLDVWLPFFGLYLAEGSASIVKNKSNQEGHERGHGYFVSIAHFDVENLREIQRRLSDWFDVKVYENIGKLRINDKQLVAYLRQFGKAWEKFIPDWIKALPPNRLHSLWDWYMRGDGHDHRVGYTTSFRLRDDWQEVAMYMGLSADWVITKSKKRLPKINGREIHARRPSYEVTFNHVQSQPQVYDRSGLRNPVRTLVPAEDWGGRMVYCVELEKHHTLYVRRNGKAVWCGNTRTWDIMSVGLRAAGFDNRDTISSLFGSPCLQWLHCLSEDTEVLTGAGWKGYKELQTGDAVACWNPDNESIQPLPFTKMWESLWDGPLSAFRNDDVDCLVTPNHRVYHRVYQRKQTEGVRVGAYSSWQALEASEVSRTSKIKIPTAGFCGGIWGWRDGLRNAGRVDLDRGGFQSVRLRCSHLSVGYGQPGERSVHRRSS